MIIFSLDGTLADCEHRRHFIEKPERCECPYRCCICKKCEQFNEWKPDWQAFYEACDKDIPIVPTLSILSKFMLDSDRHVEIWSGRCESVRKKTVDWLCENWFLGLFDFEVERLNESIKMRPIGDTTPADQLKERWLNERIDDMGNQAVSDIEFVFASDPKEIAMWRRRGIFVFDVNQTGKEF
jgi:hypothetical protein